MMNTNPSSLVDRNVDDLLQTIDKILSNSTTKDDDDDDLDRSTRCVDILNSLTNEVTTTTTTTNTTTTKKKTTITNETNGKTTIDRRTLKPSVVVSETSQEKTKKSLTKAIRCFRRYKRTTSTTEIASTWEKAIQLAKALNDVLAVAVAPKKESVFDSSSSADYYLRGGGDAASSSSNTESTNPHESTNEVLPTCSSSYRARLTMHKKEIYKDPPVLPPPSITIYSCSTCPSSPTRNKQTGEYTFATGTLLLKNETDDEDEDEDYNNNNTHALKEALKTFHPNRSPEDILRAGAFGGTYFRPITSSVTNIRYTSKQVLQDTLPSEWISDIDTRTMLTSSTYRESINKFGVKCGGSLGMWESSGWISDVDPYGWFQWYCRFFNGRRCSDDLRQIGRWSKLAGPKGRFRSQLCNKILNAGNGGLGKVDDVRISPVIRQTLLHWGIEITKDILLKHGKRVKRL